MNDEGNRVSSIDLTGSIQNVIDGALERAGRACVIN